MEDLKQSLFDFIDKDIEETIKKELTSDFSWEMYFKFQLFDKCLNILSKKFIGLSRPNLTQKETKELSLLSDFFSNRAELAELENKIKLIKDEMIANKTLKEITYKEMENKIFQFFKTKRNIDFELLNKEEQMKLLGKEDIFISKENIYDYLKISHYQYKYLYQRGSFLTSFS